MKPGDKIKFLEERFNYTVRAAGKRFVVCTRPHFKTVMYTVLDLVDQVRGTENLVFGMGAETDKQCRDMLKRIESGETELPRRNTIPLNIVKITQDPLLLKNGKKLGEELIWQDPEVLKPKDSSESVPLTERYKIPEELKTDPKKEGRELVVKTFRKGE